jgi:hypothetical protein
MAARAITLHLGLGQWEHRERSLILNLALAESTAKRGRKGGRPTVVDEVKHRAILGHRAEGQSLREISRVSAFRWP